MIAQLFLDIETIPSQFGAVMDEIREGCKAELDAALECITHPANYKDPAKIAEWNATVRLDKVAALKEGHEATVEECYRKTGLDGAFGQIACVSFAYLDGEPITVSADDIHNPRFEDRLLSVLDDCLCNTIPVNMMHAVQVVGHNVSAFDLRFIVQRSIVRGIRPHPIIVRAMQAKPWETERVFDTMVQWAGVGKTIKLDKLCKALGLPGKGDLDGSKVWDYVKSGRLAEVADYCADDVRKVRSVWQRMTFQTVEELEDVPA